MQMTSYNEGFLEFGQTKLHQSIKQYRPTFQHTSAPDAYCLFVSGTINMISKALSCNSYNGTSIHTTLPSGARMYLQLFLRQRAHHFPDLLLFFFQKSQSIGNQEPMRDQFQFFDTWRKHLDHFFHQSETVSFLLHCNTGSLLAKIVVCPMLLLGSLSTVLPFLC